MKKIWYILLVGYSLGFFACNDVEVGYLDIKNATYAIDSLHIYDVKSTLDKYSADYDAGMSSLLAEIEELENQEADMEDELDALMDQIYDLEDQMYDPGISDEEYDELERQMAELEASYNDLYAEYRALGKQIASIQENTVDKVAQELGFESEAMMKSEIVKLENRIKYQSPWVTQPIESVLGTEPLSYAIANVKNDNLENAELFRQSLTIMGGGRMNVAFGCKAPAGRYVVSIEIENEGQRAVLEEVYTFIVDK
ncbi:MULTISPECIES: hypothetical protein [unclassified Butyricimonas]|nr:MULTISPECIES: hypothetical protein [unclassified Butyricimonas]